MCGGIGSIDHYVIKVDGQAWDPCQDGEHDLLKTRWAWTPTNPSNAFAPKPTVVGKEWS